MEKAKKKCWVGTPPAQCNLCKAPIHMQFWDARIRGTSTWVIMCHVCWVANGAPLGTGLGQHYRLKPTQTEYVKVAG